MSNLTDAEIDAMPAGREMDCLIATKVMGLNVKVDVVKLSIPNPDYDVIETFHRLVDGRGEYIRDVRGAPPVEVDPYSTNIAAAFKVVDHIWRSLHLEIVMGGHDDYWWCEFGTPETEQLTSTGMGADRAEAINRAALKAALRSKEAGR